MEINIDKIDIIKNENITEDQKTVLEFLNRFEKTREYFYGFPIDESFGERLYLKERVSSSDDRFKIKEQDTLNSFEFFLSLLQRKIALCRRNYDKPLKSRSVTDYKILDVGPFLQLQCIVTTGNRSNKFITGFTLSWFKGKKLYNQTPGLFHNFNILIDFLQETDEKVIPR